MTWVYITPACTLSDGRSGRKRARPPTASFIWLGLNDLLDFFLIKLTLFRYCFDCLP